MPFEVVSTDIEESKLIEEIPIVGNSFACLYKNDGQGPASTNTGFFTIQTRFYPRRTIQNQKSAVTQK